jgi:hypothetical protein
MSTFGRVRAEKWTFLMLKEATLSPAIRWPITFFQKLKKSHHRQSIVPTWLFQKFEFVENLNPHAGERPER